MSLPKDASVGATRNSAILDWQLWITAFLIGGSFSNQAVSAPCCGAGAAMPAVLVNDDLAQVSLAISQSATVMDAGNSGPARLRSSGNEDDSTMTRLSGAHRFGEFFQAGASFAVVSRQVENSGRKSQASGLSDTDLFLGYEFLPEWTYSTWRPRGFAYFQQVLPTGRAIQDPEKKNAADVRGLGVSQSALGAVFLKSWAEWDLSITPELRRFYSADLGATQIGSGWGASMLLNGGYSWLDLGLRVGLRTQPVLQSSRALKSQEVSGGFESEISSKSVWNSGVDFSWMPNDQWRANVGYSDQTWFGPARNTTLERSVAISGQYRWAL